MPNINHKKPLILFSAAGIVLVFIILALLLRGDSTNLPSAEVQFGDFLIKLESTGEVMAANSINISAPRVRTNLQIVKIAPEGTVVDSGDFLIQFDTNDINKVIDEKQAELEIAQANLEKSQASMEANLGQMESSLENTLASYELAKLRLEQMAFEAEVRVQEERLRFRQAEISLEQTRAKIESQKKMDAAELTTLNLKIQQAKAELVNYQEQFEKLTLTAPAPGLVVYQKIWKGSGMEKIKVGDTPWRGQSLIQLPDLSKMQVATEISEVDIGKLEKEQTVTIKLDAFPDPTFTGKVSDIASLAHEKSGESSIKVFDVTIDIEQTDPVLKPGMTAKASILIEKIPEKIFVPIESVFEKNGKKVVYVLNGKPEAVEVETGKRNENFVIVIGKLEAGQLVSLVDPIRPLAIEPEKEKKSLEMPGKGKGSSETVVTITEG